MKNLMLYLACYASITCTFFYVIYNITDWLKNYPRVISVLSYYVGCKFLVASAAAYFFIFSSIDAWALLPLTAQAAFFLALIRNREVVLLTTQAYLSQWLPTGQADNLK